MPFDPESPVEPERVAVSKIINSLSEAGLKVAILQLKHVRSRAGMSAGVVRQVAASLRGQIPMSEVESLRIAQDSILETAAFRWANV